MITKLFFKKLFGNMPFCLKVSMGYLPAQRTRGILYTCQRTLDVIPCLITIGAFYMNDL